MMTGSNYMLEQEGFIVFNPFQNHEIYRKAGCHTLSAYIPFSLLQYCGLGKVACCSAVQQDQVPYLEMIRARLAVIFKNYMEGSARRRLYILSNILGFLAVLKQQFEPRTEQPDEKIRHPANKMQQELLYIHAHYTENITLQDVADNAYMSVSHLSREFEKQTGMHFSEFQITKEAASAGQEELDKVETVLYVMADKFLESAEMDELMEVIGVTRLGQKLVNRGIEQGIGKRRKNRYCAESAWLSG